MSYDIGYAVSRDSFLMPLLTTIPNSSNLPSGPSHTLFFDHSGATPAIHGSEDDSLKWAAANIDQLRKDYPMGSWVLVKNCKIVGAGSDLIKILGEADRLGIDKPLTIRIEKPSTARRSAYATWFANRSS